MRGMGFACIAALAASCHLVSGIHELDYDSGGAGSGPGPGENGAPCSESAECDSSHCVDDVCCESACDASCSSCALEGSAGTCSLHAPGTDPDGECMSGSCDASGACVGANLVFGNTIGNVDINDMAARSDGAFFVVGAFTGDVELGDGQLLTSQAQDMVVARYSAEGELVWKKQFGSAGQDSAEGAAVDAQGDLWITGSIDGAVNFGGGALTPPLAAPAIFLARFDAGGTHEFSDVFDSTESDEGLDVEATGDGVFVFGTHGGNLPLLDASDPFAGLFLARFNLSGEKVWALSFAGQTAAANLDGRQRLAVSPNGDCAIVGGFHHTLVFGTDVWTGHATLTDGYLARIDGNGNLLWSKSFPLNSDVTAHPDVAMDETGNVYVTGQFVGTIDFGTGALEAEGESDIFVAALDPAGGGIWSKRFGDTARQEGRAIAVDAEGTIVVTGKAQGAFDFGGGALSAAAEDLFLLRLAANGTHLFSAIYGNSSDQMGEALAIHGRSPIVGGYCEGAIDFGAGPKNCTPGAFIAGFAP